MPYAILQVRTASQRVHDIFLTDAVRRAHPYLASIKACSVHSVGKRPFRRPLMPIDVLEWCEQQSPPWVLCGVTSTGPTARDPDGGWTYLYLGRDIKTQEVPAQPQPWKQAPESPTSGT